MKSLQYFGPKDLRFVDIEMPKIEANEILLKVKKVGICGTDLHIFSGGMNVPTPLIIGHEFVGDVAQVGSDVINVNVGDKVVAEHVIGCGNCEYCQKGLKNLCIKPVVIGLHKSGALAEYMALPSELVFKLPDTLTYDDGVLVEPLSIAVYALKKTKAVQGNTVAVVGQGPIGIFVAQVATALGCKVYGIDINNSRLAHSKDAGYIDEAFNSMDEGFITKFQNYLQSDGADIVFEAVGKDATAKLSLNLAKRGGKIVILGVFEHDVLINIMEIVKKELQVRGSWTCLDSFIETIDLIAQKKVITHGLITHRYKFNDAIRAFEEAADTTTNRVKSVIEFD